MLEHRALVSELAGLGYTDVWSAETTGTDAQLDWRLQEGVELQGRTLALIGCGAIARAVARDAEIYIFDDTFSALDYKTDRQLRQDRRVTD